MLEMGQRHAEKNNEAEGHKAALQNTVCRTQYIPVQAGMPFCVIGNCWPIIYELRIYKFFMRRFVEFLWRISLLYISDDLKTPSMLCHHGLCIDTALLFFYMPCTL